MIGHRRLTFVSDQDFQKCAKHKVASSYGSQSKLAMRTKAHEFEALTIQLPINKNEIRPDVAVAVIAPLAG